jgi:large subunit ribosomal protein L4
MNKKTKEVALASALSAKVANDCFVVVDDIACTEYKTKTVVGMLKAFNAEKKPLIVLGNVNPVFVKSAANIPGAITTFAYTDDKGLLCTTLNVYDILNCGKVIIAKSAVLALQGGYVK